MLGVYCLYWKSSGDSDVMEFKITIPADDVAMNVLVSSSNVMSRFVEYPDVMYDGMIVSVEIVGVCEIKKLLTTIGSLKSSVVKYDTSFVSSRANVEIDGSCKYGLVDVFIACHVVGNDWPDTDEYIIPWPVVAVAWIKVISDVGEYVIVDSFEDIW